MHTTSLNLNEGLYVLLRETAEAMDMSASSLVKKVIARFSKHYTPLLRQENSSVAYQVKDDAGWHVFPIAFSDSEYEQCLDIRKVWKMSVSFFVSAAFMHFLQSMDDEEKTEVEIELKNSYMIKKYQMHKKMLGKAIIFIITWGEQKKQQQRE